MVAVTPGTTCKWIHKLKTVMVVVKVSINRMKYFLYLATYEFGYAAKVKDI